MSVKIGEYPDQVKSPQLLHLMGDKGNGDMYLKSREKTFFSHLRGVKEITNLIFVLSLSALLGCVAGEGGKKTATCAPGQVFDSVGRKCSGAQTVPTAPVGTTTEVSILEGEGTVPTLVYLRYTDSENDRATSCTAYTNGPGIIRFLDYQGIRIESEEDQKYPNNFKFFFTTTFAGSPSATSSVDFAGNVNITVFIPIGGATSSAVASAINAGAGTYVFAGAIESNTVSADGKVYALTELKCTCFGGQCVVPITPPKDYFGTTEFFYTLTDNDGTSSVQQVTVNVTAVNDSPVLTPNAPLTVPVVSGTAGNPFASGATETFDDNSNYTFFSLDLETLYTVTDEEGDSYTWLMTSPPGYGEVGFTSLSSAGVFTYKTKSGVGVDTIKFIVMDSQGAQSDEVELTFSYTTVSDPPIGTLSTANTILEEGSLSAVELTYTDEEGDTVTNCEITSVSKVWPVGPCTCSGSPVTCTSSFRAIPDQNGTGSFEYIIFDGSTQTTQGLPGYPVDKQVTFTITPQDDGPLLYPTVGGTTLEVAESDTFEPSTYTFDLDGGADKDGHTIVYWEVDDAPDFGTLSNCFPASGSTIPTCTYIPSNGNLANSSDTISPTIVNDVVNTNYARDTTPVTGTFYASTLGESMNGFEIEMVDVGSTTLLTGAAAYTDGQKVTIFIEQGVTVGTDIENAISANSDVAKLIQFDADDLSVANEVVPAGGSYFLSGGVATADKFTIKATDSNGDTSTRTVHISILPVADRPTLCEYSNYDETTVCGLNGCISDGIPDAITPDKDGLVFYSKSTGACYMSSGGVWSPVESYIKDRAINELDPIVIDDIRVDEGGGASEDSEGIRIIDINSSDTNLVPLGNIEIYYGDPLVYIGDGDDGVLTLDGGATSADLSKLRLVITPQTINPPVDEKTATIEIEVADYDPASPIPNIKTTEVVFDINVQKVSATHGGWVNFKATGPKVDSLGLVNEDRLVCPYSLDACESGGQCYGSTTPVNNSSADPDTADAVYMQETAGNITCYRMKRTQVQNIAYVGKTSNNVTIQYTNTNTAGAASVSVSGNVITVSIEDDVTTTDTIIAAIEASSTTNAMVKAINLKAGETQDIQGATTIAPLSNASWETFETYCSATPVALEPGCDDGSRKSCIGTVTPVGNITPTKLDSRYWDEEANVCYRSTGLTNNDWETYDAPAEVEISWNQFSINGSGSVSEYRVFRRIAGEEFDFSKPINRSTISGSSSTYTFTDNNKNSVVPPSPGTVYYYVVRPVVNDILTSTAAETGTNANGIVRIMAPPKNMAFAHRWMINKKVCSIMNKSSDATNNFRCDYKGPGDTEISGSYYYDYGKDILVDRFEAGCPYSPAPRCPFTFDNSCVGVSSPPNDPTIADHTVYYARSEGKCYLSNGGTWSEIDSTTVLSNYFTNVEPTAATLDPSDPQFDSRNDKRYHRSSLPPLTNITQENANTFCRSLTNIDSSELVGIDSALTHKLPTRRDQIAFSLWDSDSLNDSTIATTETGLSLNSSSKCNSSQASGLTDGYVDFDKPDSNDFYSLPGTNASNIRSITTGSNETVACTSSFGVQDTSGNVSEWTSNRLNCPLLSQCSGNQNLLIQNVEVIKLSQSNNVRLLIINDGGSPALTDTSALGLRTIVVNVAFNPTASDVVTAIRGLTDMDARVVSGDGTELIFPIGSFLQMGTDLSGADDFLYGSKFASLPTNASFDPYGFWSMDGLRGPCVDADSDDVCDASISSWAIEDERFSAGRFFIPMGLPAEVSANTTFDTDYSLAEIGPTSGITSLQLHDDTITVDSQNIFASVEDPGCGGFAAGGSYLSGNGAGVWNLEALPCSDTFGVLTIQDVSLRAKNADHLNVTVRFVEGDGTFTFTDFDPATNLLLVDLDDFGVNDNAANVVAAINTAAINVGGDILEAYVTGDPGSSQAAFTTPVSFNDTRVDATPRRVDVGFRCMIDIDPGDSIPGSGDNGAYDE